MNEPVDLSRIQETSDGDYEFERELIEMYLADAEMHLENLQKFLDEGDKEGMKQTAHTLKGSSSNVGAVALQNAAYHIEKLSGADDLRPILEALGQLRSKYGAVKEFFNNYLKQIS